MAISAGEDANPSCLGGQASLLEQRNHLGCHFGEGPTSKRTRIRCWPRRQYNDNGTFHLCKCGDPIDNCCASINHKDFYDQVWLSVKDEFNDRYYGGIVTMAAVGPTLRTGFAVEDYVL